LRLAKVTRPALCLTLAAVACFAQGAPKPDILVLVDGEKLIGHFESANAKTVTFKSDLAGEVKIDWAKIQDLQSSANFAIAKKGEVFARHLDTATVPQGKVGVADQKITVTPATGAPLVVPVSNTENVIPQDSFLRAFRNTKFRDYWSGAAGLGFALVDATQSSKTFTSTLSLIRTVPSEAWVSPRYRTIITFNSAYGTTESGPDTIKTNIIHGGLEQDEYFNQRLFAFGQGTFDHNYSQGLSLQYTLGGGVGFVAYKDAHQELDLKAQVAYTSQLFNSAAIVGTPSVAAPSATHLVGAVVGETYTRTLRRCVSLNEQLSVTPAFNEVNDYSANGTVNLGFPISERMNVTVGVLDSYLNDPPPDFRKNSFQFVTNLIFKVNKPDHPGGACPAS
jgi:hypothetical protein